MNADVFLLPSLWEGLPISLLEAMYMKKLCIVSDVIGNRDVIKNGQNGFVCRNVDEYVSAIQHDDIEAIVLNGKKDIVDEYNITTMARKYSVVYESIG